MTHGLCNCHCDPSAGSHKVWCEVYSNFAREHATELKEAELAAVLARTVAQFEKSNLCKRCREAIRSSDEAMLIEMGKDETYLIHSTLDCYSSEIEALIDRYLPADEMAVVA